MRWLWGLSLVSIIQKFGHWLFFSFVQDKDWTQASWDQCPSESGVWDLAVLWRDIESTTPSFGKTQSGFEKILQGLVEDSGKWTSISLNLYYALTGKRRLQWQSPGEGLFLHHLWGAQGGLPPPTHLWGMTEGNVTHSGMPTALLMCCFKETEGCYEAICTYKEINQCL